MIDGWCIYEKYASDFIFFERDAGGRSVQEVHVGALFHVSLARGFHENSVGVDAVVHVVVGVGERKMVDAKGALLREDVCVGDGACGEAVHAVGEVDASIDALDVLLFLIVVEFAVKEKGMAPGDNEIAGGLGEFALGANV